MSQNYDNWERLVRAVLQRQHDREIALCDSSNTSSIDTTSSSSQFDFDDSVALQPRRKYRAIAMDYSDLTLDHRDWKAMLPPGKHQILYRSASVCFFLDRRTRKNCFLLGATSLGFPEDIWDMGTHPKSRFSEVVVGLPNLGVCGRINMQMLSPKTLYGAYCVFELTNDKTRPCCPTNSMIKVSYSGGNYYEVQKGNIQFHLGKDRADGWKEIQLGTFYVREGERPEVEAQILYTTCPLLKSVILEGIEFLPSSEQNRPQHLLKQDKIEETCGHKDIDNDHKNVQKQNVQIMYLDDDDPESWCFNKGR